MSVTASAAGAGDSLKLFVVMLGGRAARANTEVHDVVFAVAPSLQKAYPQLRQQWFGEKAGLHIDSWMEVDGVDEWQVRLDEQPPPAGAPRLYFVNLGGYAPGEFGEAHRYLLVVAGDPAQAKRLALQQADRQWLKPHRDALFEVDTCMPLGPIGGLHVQLQRGPHAGIRSHSDYIVIS